MGAALSLAGVATPVVAGAAIGMQIAPEIQGWYRTLKKSKLTPPDSVFGPVWSVLYTMMGISSVMAAKAGAPQKALILYGAQLAANLLWSPLFFKQKDLTLASADIAAVVGLAAATHAQFKRVSPDAAKLLVPYIAWCSYAAVLTGAFWKDNPGARTGPARARLQSQVRRALGGARRATSPPPAPRAGGGKAPAAAAAADAAADAVNAAGSAAAAAAKEVEGAAARARAKVAAAAGGSA